MLVDLVRYRRVSLNRPAMAWYLIGAGIAVALAGLNLGLAPTIGRYLSAMTRASGSPS